MVCRITPASIHTATKPATNSAVDRPRRREKLRSRTCHNGAIASGSIIATTISAQPTASCDGELKTSARSNDTESDGALHPCTDP